MIDSQDLVFARVLGWQLACHRHAAGHIQAAPAVPALVDVAVERLRSGAARQMGDLASQLTRPELRGSASTADRADRIVHSRSDLPTLGTAQASRA
jgi:hypothetical protein